jgi:branched-subunit amino acid transport protein
MSAIWLILGMGAGVYALRLSGLVLRDVTISPAWERALGYVPVALLTALVVASLTSQFDGSPTRWVAAAGAAVAARVTGRMWACILAGMGVYWALSLV